MVAEPVALQLARPADASALALMSRDLVETGLGWTYQPHRIAELIGDPEAVALVTRDGPRTVGFAIMRFGDERAHLVLLAVRPAHRRRGIARRMLTWLFDSAGVAGSASVHVELRADNAPAYATYEAMGFAETLRIPHYYLGRETAVRMLRVLRAPGFVPSVWRPPAHGPG
jgi:ribosomal-protein-alanine N-acetyltransferase